MTDDKQTYHESWVNRRLNESGDFSAGWNSALWEVAKECIGNQAPLARQIYQLCVDLAHHPREDGRP